MDEKEIGARLREERNRLHLVQADVCEKLGLPRRHSATIWRWENGQNAPLTKHWVKLHSLGYDVLYVLTGERRT